MVTSERSGEFDLIARYFAPLTKNVPGALGLRDDAALLSPEPGMETVVTADMLVAGVHFFSDDPPGDIASKALRVNLSDLAAMGAGPRGYLLSLALDATRGEGWISAFAAGLGEAQDRFGTVLLGGDTVSTPGPLTISITALGAVPLGRALRRSGAHTGDGVFVSGSIGDGTLGLMARRGDLSDVAPQDRAWCSERLLRPTPRLDLGRRLLGLANSAIDVSDGLVADLGHICVASGRTATIEAEHVPLSPPARRLVDRHPDLLRRLVTGGDDYELLFTVARNRENEIAPLAAALDLPLTRIGIIEAELETDRAPVTVRAPDGAPWTLGAGGYRHF